MAIGSHANAHPKKASTPWHLLVSAHCCGYVRKLVSTHIVMYMLVSARIYNDICYTLLHIGACMDWTLMIWSI